MLIAGALLHSRHSDSRRIFIVEDTAQIAELDFPSQYSAKRVAGLLFGNGMEPFLQILSSSDSNARCFFLLDGNYEHFYYLTNDHYGEVLLKKGCFFARLPFEIIIPLERNLRSWLFVDEYILSIDSP